MMMLSRPSGGLLCRSFSPAGLRIGRVPLYRQTLRDSEFDPLSGSEKLQDDLHCIPEGQKRWGGLRGRGEPIFIGLWVLLGALRRGWTWWCIFVSFDVPLPSIIYDQSVWGYSAISIFDELLEPPKLELSTEHPLKNWSPPQASA